MPLEKENGELNVSKEERTRWTKLTIGDPVTALYSQNFMKRHQRQHGSIQRLDVHSSRFASPLLIS